MKKNKELMPEEKTIYAYKWDDLFIVYGRIGNEAFGSSLERDTREFSHVPDEEWERGCHEAEESIRNSMSFFEEHGILPKDIDAPKRKLKKLKNYPVFYVQGKDKKDHGY